MLLLTTTWAYLRHRPIPLAGAGVVGGLVLVAALAPWIAPPPLGGASWGHRHLLILVL